MGSHQTPALALVLSLSLVVSVVCYPDLDVTTNCSSTGYPAVHCNAPSNTVTLDLSHNHMEKIPAGCFPNLPKLQRLLLQFNSISSVDPYAFQHNPVLEYLDISHNLLPQISALPFTSLPALTYLDISNNAYEDILLEQSFDPHGNLQSLKLGSSHSVSIRKDHVKRLGELHLEDVHLVAGEINVYEIGSLLTLKQLNMVTIESEYSTDLAKEILMWIDICNNTKALTVLRVDLTKNDIVFPVHDLLQASSFSKLVAKDIKVDGVFCDLLPYFFKSSLEEIYFENIIGKGQCNMTFGTFDRCHVRKISVNGIDNRDFLRFRPHETITKFMGCLTDISAVNIGSRYFPCVMSDWLVNLKTLNVSINDLTEERLLQCRSPFPALQSLAIDFNKFQHIGILGNKTAHMKDLVNFTATYNQIHLEPQTVFINWTKSLRRLNLRSNQLTDDVLQFLPQTLVMLDVSYNDIQTVSSLQVMTDLRELFLSGNKIMTLHSEVFPSSLCLLHVDRNNMSTISVATIRSLSLTELDFSGNPLHCDCDTLELAQFCRDSSNTKVLGWPSGYRCQSPDSLKNETLEELSLSWPSCHKGPFALIMICCICIPIICFLLYKKFHGHVASFYRRTSYASVS